MAYIVRTLIYRYYKNYLCSVTGLFFVVLYLFALIFPFLFAVSTGEFWQQVKVTSDQPQISLNGNYIIQCHSGYLNYTSSNIVSVTDQDYADFQYMNEDPNNDGMADYIQFSINYITASISEQCTVVLFANVGMRNEIKLQMIAPIVMSFNEDFENFGVYLNGRLDFHQKATLPQLTSARLIYNNEDYNYPYNTFDLKKELNETVLPVYESVRFMKVASSEVQIQGYLKIPTFQRLYYKPTVIQSFREVWIQYIFIAIPTFYIIGKLGSFAVQRKIFFAHSQVYNDQYNTF